MHATQLETGSLVLKARLSPQAAPITDVERASLMLRMTIVAILLKRRVQAATGLDGFT